jgi:hypothetical protein
MDSNTLAEKYQHDLSGVIRLVGTAADPPRFEWMNARDVFSTPMPPARWVVPAMELGPGRPCGLWGVGGAGKSWEAMEIERAVASGTKAFGHFDVTRGRVSHVSHELGQRAVRDRFRRLANGNAMKIDDFADNLRIVCLPKLFLNTPGAESEYAREFDGDTLVVIDSLRRALPGEKENDSEISNFLDILNRVSEKTGATFLVLHHCGKSQFDDKRLTARGSSAIMDGSGCVWLLEGKGAEPRRMEQVRAHDDGDGDCPSFGVELQRGDGSAATFPASRAPVRLVRQEASVIAADLRDQIRQYFRDNGDQPGKTALCKSMAVNRSLFFAAISELEKAGEIINVGTYRQPSLRLVTS